MYKEKKKQSVGLIIALLLLLGLMLSLFKINALADAQEISSVKIGIRNFYVQKGSNLIYFVENGVKKEPPADMELEGGDSMGIEYDWALAHADIGTAETTMLKQGNYFQVELPDSNYFEGFSSTIKTIYLDVTDRENNTVTPYVFGTCSVIETEGKAYLRMSLTSEQEVYNKIISEITENIIGNLSLSMKVKEVTQSTTETIHVPGMDSDSIQIRIKPKPTPPPEPGQGNDPNPPTKPLPNIPFGKNYFKQKMEKSGYHPGGKDYVQWWLLVNRDSSLDQYKDDYVEKILKWEDSTIGKNMIVYDDIEAITAFNKDGVAIDKTVHNIQLIPESLEIYLDMLPPAVENNEVTKELSSSPIAHAKIYNNFTNNKLNKFGYREYFKSALEVSFKEFEDYIKENPGTVGIWDNKKLMINFGDIPNRVYTYTGLFGGEEALKQFITDNLSKRYQHYALTDQQKKTFQTMENMMFNTYSKLPIMHYTVAFQTRFSRLDKNDQITNTSTLTYNEDKVIEGNSQIKLVTRSMDGTASSGKYRDDVVVRKEWKNSDQTAYVPEDGVEIKVQLYANDEKYGEPVILSKENNWKHIFKGYRKKTIGGEPIRYSVKEVEVPEGFRDKLTIGEDGVFIITNTKYPALPSDPPKPPTPEPPPGNPYIPPLPPDEPVVLPPDDLPKKEEVIDEDDVVKTNKEEEIEDNVPKVGLPKTHDFWNGFANPLSVAAVILTGFGIRELLRKKKNREGKNRK